MNLGHAYASHAILFGKTKHIFIETKKTICLGA